MHERYPEIVEEIIKIAKEEWIKRPNTTIERLFDSIPRKMKCIISNDGNQTKY